MNKEPVELRAFGLKGQATVDTNIDNYRMAWSVPLRYSLMASELAIDVLNNKIAIFKYKGRHNDEDLRIFELDEIK